MKTIEQAAEQSGIDPDLIRAVIGQTGRESLPDIAKCGVSGGFPGFTWHKDTVAFYKRHREQILKLAERVAESSGEDMVQMIRNFNCLSSGPSDKRKSDVTASEVAEALYRGRGEMAVQIQNALAWFAAEEVARAMCDED